MPLLYNGNSPIRIKYNGNEVRKVKWTVWKGGEGKNLFKLPDSGTLNYITYTKNADGTFNLTGTAGSVTTFYINVDTALPSGDYILSRNFNNSNVRFILQDFNGTSWISTMVTFSSGTSSQVSLNPVGNATRFMVQVLSGASVNITNGEIQLEKGTTATPFVPYENVPTVWRLLPEEYTEVEWLQSTSGAYMRLDYYPHADTTFDVLWAYKGTDTKALAVFGAGTVGAGNPETRPNYVLTSTSSAPLVGMYYASTWTGFSPSVDISTGENFRFLSTVNSETFRVYAEGGGARNLSYRDFTCDEKLSLFSAGGTNRSDVYRIYYAKFFEHGEIVLDLVPAIRNSDNEPGMYDLVNKVFYTNNGTGSFTTGPAIG